MVYCYQEINTYITICWFIVRIYFTPRIFCFFPNQFSYCLGLIVPPGSFVLPLFGGVGVHDVCPETLQVSRKRQMLSKVHLVAERSGVLGLDACVAQQRLENNLRGETEIKIHNKRHVFSDCADCTTQEDKHESRQDNGYVKSTLKYAKCKFTVSTNSY